MYQIDPDKLVSIEEKNRERLAGWWDIAGEEPRYPLGTEDVARLLNIVDYAVDHDTLLSWLTAGAIPPVPRQASRLAWTATNIVCAAAAAEARRMWKPFSAIHGAKFSMVEKLKQVLDSEGQPTFTDLAQFDIPALLGIMHQVSGDKGATETMVEALRHKLQNMGVLCE